MSACACACVCVSVHYLESAGDGEAAKDPDVGGHVVVFDRSVRVRVRLLGRQSGDDDSPPAQRADGRPCRRLRAVSVVPAPPPLPSPAGRSGGQLREHTLCVHARVYLGALSLCARPCSFVYTQKRCG